MLSEDEARRIESEVDTLGAEAVALLAGSLLLTTSQIKGASAPSMLEQAYLAGRLSTKRGARSFEALAPAKVEALWKKLASEVSFSPAERVAMGAMASQLSNDIALMVARYKAQVQSTLNAADSELLANIMMKKLGNDEVAKLKGELIKFASRDLGKMSVEADLKRLIQTASVSAFQAGQVAGRDPEEWVYKIPRPGACRHCIRLHLTDGGKPRKYKLKDVRGNSNRGQKAFAWKFTIGPVHPHCRCALRIEKVDGPAEDYPAVEI